MLMNTSMMNKTLIIGWKQEPRDRKIFRKDSNFPDKQDVERKLGWSVETPVNESFARRRQIFTVEVCRQDSTNYHKSNMIPWDRMCE